MDGLFITFEGIEGCGKSTQARILADWLTQKGFRVVLTREPGDGEIGARIRELLLSVSSSLDPLTELFLLAADRTRHVQEIVQPGLDQAAIVISDRYADSSVAYQGYGRGLDLGFIDIINSSAVKGCLPDLTLVLDIDPEISIRRSQIRLHQQNMFEAEGRFEKENIEFHRRVRDGYRSLAVCHPERIILIGATGTVEQIHAEIWRVISQRLGSGSKAGCFND